MVELAVQIGNWPEDGTIPTSVLSHEWSALNYPLMWAAAECQASHPIVDWLDDMCEGYAGLPLRPYLAWLRLRRQFRPWGVHSADFLSAWLGNQGWAR